MQDPLPDLIVFDGVCVLCNGWARFVTRHDRAGVFRFVTAQSAVGQQIYRDLGLDAQDFETLIVRLDGCYLLRSDAIIAVVTRFGGLWRAAALLRLIPRRLRDAAYGPLARNRYRIFGRHDTCPLPTPDLRARLMDDVSAAGDRLQTAEA